MKSTNAYTVDSQVARVPAEVRPIVEAARATVRAAAPGAVEIAYQGEPPSNPSTMWKLARYTVDGESRVGIGTFRRHSALFFQRGAEFDDGTGLLQGGGKASRFVPLRTPEDAERPEVRRLVERAVAAAR